MLGVIVVTDEEDCSSSNTSHLRPPNQLAPTDPNYNVDLNLRCWKNPQNLYPVERYVNAFKALRGGDEDLVMYGAIVGVPPDLVDAKARALVNFDDAAARDAYYDHILNDPRMVPMVDPTLPSACVPD